MSLVWWSDAALGYQSTGGRRRLGCAIGQTSSALTAIRHSAQWKSKFTRELVKSSLVGEVYALSEMVDHTSPLWSFFRPCESLDPGIAGMGDCEGLFTYSKSKRMIARKYLVRYF